jgi:hypothetical protein
VALNLGKAHGRPERDEGHCSELQWRSLANELRWSLLSSYGWQQHGERVTAWHNRGERCTPRRWPLGHVAGKWVRQQGGHSAPTSATAKIFSHKSLSARSPGTNRSTDKDRGAGSSAVSSVNLRSFAGTVAWRSPLVWLTERFEEWFSPIFL